MASKFRASRELERIAQVIQSGMLTDEQLELIADLVCKETESRKAEQVQHQTERKQTCLF